MTAVSIFINIVEHAWELSKYRTPKGVVYRDGDSIDFADLMDYEGELATIFRNGHKSAVVRLQDVTKKGFLFRTVENHFVPESELRLTRTIKFIHYIDGKRVRNWTVPVTKAGLKALEAKRELIEEQLNKATDNAIDYKSLVSIKRGLEKLGYPSAARPVSFHKHLVKLANDMRKYPVALMVLRLKEIDKEIRELKVELEVSK